MATFLFRKTKLDEVKQALFLYGSSACVFFQPTHHAGCLQVCSDDPDIKDRGMPKKKWSEIHHTDVFANKVTGYQAFCNQTTLTEDVLKLDEGWVEFIQKSKWVKITVRAVKKDGKSRIHYNMLGEPG
jgi:hypothetical protein